MIIGHLPAGYIAARAALGVGGSVALFWGILIGSILPDLDMLWFHLVDHGTVHHHNYVTHKPIIWALVLVAGLALRQSAVAGIGLGGLLHMCLDSIAGAISWLWPFSEHVTTLVVVPATRDHWLFSFIFHWTFTVEIGVTLVALGLLVSARRRR